MNLFLRYLKDELIYGGHLLSLGASSIVWSSYIIMDIPINLWLILIAYLTSQIVYNLDHLIDIFQGHISENSEREKYLKKTKNIQVFLYFLYVIVFIFLIIKVSFLAFFSAVLIVFGGIVYTLKAKYLTKKIIAFKNVYIALFWSVLALLVPLQEDVSILNEVVVSFFLYIFIRLLVNTIYFDIKDVSCDARKQLKTIPVLLGLTRTLRVLHILNFISGVFIVYTILMEYIPAYTAILILFPFYSYFYLSKSKKYTRDVFRKISYIIVDGEYLLWPITLLVSKITI